MTKRLVRVGLLLTAANLIAGALGYVFQISMSRMLLPADFALFSSIMAASAIICAPFSSFATAISRRLVGYIATGSEALMLQSFKASLKEVSALAIFVVLIFFLAGSPISNFIDRSSRVEILLLSFIVGVTAIGSLNNAFLHGMQNFRWLARMAILTVSFKILFSIFAVYFKMGVDGVLLSVVFAGAISAIIVVNHLYRLPKSEDCDGLSQETLSLRKLKFSQWSSVLLANGTLTFMCQIDVLMVNNYFEASAAGFYATAAIFGKAIIYLPCGVVTALFPMAAEAREKNQGVAILFYRALILALCICVAAASFLSLFGHYFVGFIYKDGVKEIYDVIKYYGWMALPLSLLIVVETFLIAIGKVIYGWIALFVMPLQIFLVQKLHNSIFEVMMIIALTATAMLLLGYLYVFREIHGQQCLHGLEGCNKNG